jgi:hypothetical protein
VAIDEIVSMTDEMPHEGEIVGVVVTEEAVVGRRKLGAEKKIKLWKRHGLKWRSKRPQNVKKKRRQRLMKRYV